MSHKFISVVFNPASAGGKTGKKLSNIKKLLNKYFIEKYTLHVTSKPLDATVIARNALKEGHSSIIAVGGDGTIQEVVNGFFENGKQINSHARLGIINCGTGCGLAQSLQIPDDIDKQFEIIYNGASLLIDIGKSKFHNGGLTPLTRYFVNELQLGIGGAVVKKVKQRQKILGGFWAFGLTTISTIFTQPNQNMSIHIDSKAAIKQKFLGIIIANGAFTGGGMNLAPYARLNDNFLDVLLIHEQSVTQRLKTFPKIYSGKHVELPQFGYYQVKKVNISAEKNVLLEADGELLGHPPCEIEILPSCIQVFTDTNPSQSLTKSCESSEASKYKKGPGNEKIIKHNS
jgi:YegS/Rv2252/BmrU family lipid kinase